MILDPGKNYIVSGIERSGTSMMMQLLVNAGIPVSADDKRPPDEHNPKGYYELEGGKIINRLMDGSFDFEKYKGSFIKITAYGLKFLPPGDYKIIYSERDIEEILNSMEKMAKISDDNRKETKNAFLKLNSMIKNLLNQREDIEVLYVNYNKIIHSPEEEIKKIPGFLKRQDIDLEAMIQTVDKTLYHPKTTNNS